MSIGSTIAMKTSAARILTAVFAAATLALAEAASSSQRPPPGALFPSTSPTAAAASSTANATPTASSIPSAPSTAASPAVGIRGYRRFHANDSHIGRPIPCTYEEKVCFRHNVLFAPEKHRCLPARGDPCVYAADRVAFSNGSGHLFARCPGYYDTCTKNGGYRMAYDGRCYPRQVVRDVLCGCPAEPTPHFLGGVECRCGAAAPVHVEQPAEDGRCRVPDLRFPDNERSFLLVYPEPSLVTTLNCSRQQAACFSQGKVKMGGETGCFTIGERGPCASDHVVALDLRAALSSRAEATCVHVRGGCPEGEKRFDFDGQCHRDGEIELLTYRKIYFSEYGRYLVPHGFIKTFEPRLVGNIEGDWSCNLYHTYVASIGRTLPLPPCGANDKGSCGLPEVVAIIPEPLFDV